VFVSETMAGKSVMVGSGLVDELLLYHALQDCLCRLSDNIDRLSGNKKPAEAGLKGRA